ncbi:MAG: DMT family transporter [Actinomycetota bacterium]|nr:DMT family transporter [Actinomycetota bacterium]
MPQILALISAVLFGVSDFTGGIATRRVSAWVVAAWSQLLGLPILVLGLVVVTSTEVTRHDLMWGAIGGVFGVVGLAIMYSTLAAGKMSVVAPVIGAGAAGIPVMWAVATGETITWINWIGICVAGLAVFLLTAQSRSSRSTAEALDRKLLFQALVAAFGFAVFFIALGQTSEASGLWPLVAARSTTVPVAFGALFLGAAKAGSMRTVWKLILGTGMLDMAANIAIVLAVQRGPIGITAVLGSLYPVFTVAAAIVVLRERPTVRQLVGIALATTAIVTLAV